MKNKTGGTKMPELCRFYNIIIKMIYSDNGQHNKPHFHVYFAEYEASVGVDGELLAGSLPVKQLKLVQAWAAIHEDELYKAWNKIFDFSPLFSFPAFAPLTDRAVFDGVYIDYGVTVWNDGDIDIDPAELYSKGVPA